MNEWHSAFARVGNISVIDFHVPTEGTAESGKDTYYETVIRTLEAFLRYDVKIILEKRPDQFSNAILAPLAYIKTTTIAGCGLF